MTNPLGFHADAYRNDFTEAENRTFTEQFASITTAMAAAMAEGVPVTDERVQEQVRAHYEFCLQFWTPTREAYKSLAMSYLLPSPYRDAYESVAEGLGKYHYDAIILWADTHLD